MKLMHYHSFVWTKDFDYGHREPYSLSLTCRQKLPIWNTLQSPASKVESRIPKRHSKNPLTHCKAERQSLGRTRASCCWCYLDSLAAFVRPSVLCMSEAALPHFLPSFVVGNCTGFCRGFSFARGTWIGLGGNRTLMNWDLASAIWFHIYLFRNKFQEKVGRVFESRFINFMVWAGTSPRARSLNLNHKFIWIIDLEPKPTPKFEHNVICSEFV